MQSIHHQTWEPETAAEAAIVLVHGAGEHIGRYEHVAQWFVEQRIAVIGGDLPGLGRSAGRRGHIDDFEEYIKTAREWLLQAKSRFGEVPIFMLGHSMGGLVVTRLLQAPDAASLPIRGAVLSSPCYALKLAIPAWKQRLAAVLDLMAPTFRMPNGIDSTSVSRSPEIVHAYSVDPHIESRVSVRWFTQLQKAMQLAMAEAAAVTQPVFLLQAGADLLVDPNKPIQFIEKVASSDKKIIVYPDLYHELLNEPERRQVFADMLEWISARK